MPSYRVATPQRTYEAVVERGILNRAVEFLPPQHGNVFVVSTRDVWDLYGAQLSLPGSQVLFFPGGETRKRLAEVEALADGLASGGADRSSVVVAFGGGIVTDVGGFVAATFMRGIELIQIPTTLLAQVDAAVGGKTGVNLASGKNLAGSFYQPRCVLIDPAVVATLPAREYRAGLFEVLKHGVIADPALFELMRDCSPAVLAQAPGAVDRMIADSVRIKAEVVSADEKESDLRRILNFGHTFGHALEAETGYSRFLHGEAVAWGMMVATRLASFCGFLASVEARDIEDSIARYGPLPALDGVCAESIFSRLQGDKKTVRGKIFFVLPDRVGHVRITADVEPALVMQAIRSALPA